MPDISDIQAAQAVKIVGSDSAGVEQTPVQSTVNGALHSNLRDASGNEVAVKNTAPLTSDYGIVVRTTPDSNINVTKVSLTPSAPTFYGATNISGIAVAANVNRKGLIIINTSNTTVSLSFGANPAILNSGITLNANGGTWVMDEYTFTTQAINAITNAATKNLSIQEFST